MSEQASTIAAIIVAGGTGSRFGRDGGKQLAELAGRPVIAWTIDAVVAIAGISAVVVVCHPDSLAAVGALLSERSTDGPVFVVVPGGDTRRASVAAGLGRVPEEADIVLVHDGARPLATAATMQDVLHAFVSSECDGMIVGHPSVDTIKVVAEGRVVRTPDRETLWAVQTPQVFYSAVLREAHASALRDGFEGTDDASLVERIGGVVRVHEGPRDNVKITLREDIAFAESVLRSRDRGDG